MKFGFKNCMGVAQYTRTRMVMCKFPIYTLRSSTNSNKTYDSRTNEILQSQSLFQTTLAHQISSVMKACSSLQSEINKGDNIEDDQNL